MPKGPPLDPPDTPGKPPRSVDSAMKRVLNTSKERIDYIFYIIIENMNRGYGLVGITFH
jgi:hypothetical protein